MGTVARFPSLIQTLALAPCPWGRGLERLTARATHGTLRLHQECRRTGHLIRVCSKSVNASQEPIALLKTQSVHLLEVLVLNVYQARASDGALLKLAGLAALTQASPHL